MRKEQRNNGHYYSWGSRPRRQNKQSTKYENSPTVSCILLEKR
jgi:hypothetical protein